MQKTPTLARFKESAIKAFFFTNGILAVFILLGIFIFLLVTAVPAFREIDIMEFFTSKRLLQ